MEITTTQMYWYVMLDSINIGSGLLCAITMFLFIGLLTVTIDTGECPGILKFFIPFLGVLSFALFAVCVFLPNTKQMAAIVIVPKIANSEKVQTVGNKVYDLAVEWMEELKPNNKEVGVTNATKDVN